jgi:hypothetical protein
MPDDLNQLPKLDYEPIREEPDDDPEDPIHSKPHSRQVGVGIIALFILIIILCLCFAIGF